MAALATWLWPADKSSFLDDPVALFAFCTAVVFWIAVEIKLSEEVQIRDSSPNDVRLARILLQYHAEQFRILLKDHDFHSTIHPRYISEVGYFLNEYETRHLSFQKKQLTENFEKFCKYLTEFSRKVAEYTVPYNFPGGFRTSVRGPENMNDFEISDSHAREIKELNELGFKAWDALDELVISIKRNVPESLDDSLKIEWLSPDHDREKPW